MSAQLVEDEVEYSCAGALDGDARLVLKSAVLLAIGSAPVAIAAGELFKASCRTITKAATTFFGSYTGTVVVLPPATAALGTVLTVMFRHTLAGETGSFVGAIFTYV